MWKNQRVLAMIPARGGSKGLPCKNIRLLRGKPLIAYSIEAAQAVSIIDKVLVSTDDTQIAEVARVWGADVPFLRPVELAQDDTPTLPVIEHAIRFLTDQGERYEWVILLQPTSPCRDAEDIKGAFSLLDGQPAPCKVVSVCQTKQHPAWSYFLESNHRLAPVLQMKGTRRQDLPPVFTLNGAIYIFHVPTLLGQKLDSLPLLHWVMPAERSIDIDTEFDFRCAEVALEMREQK